MRPMEHPAELAGLLAMATEARTVILCRQGATADMQDRAITMIRGIEQHISGRNVINRCDQHTLPTWATGNSLMGETPGETFAIYKKMADDIVDVSDEDWLRQPITDESHPLYIASRALSHIISDIEAALKAL